MNFLMIATFSSIFSEVYHWKSSTVGLAYIGPGIGYLLAALSGAQISSKIYSMVSGYSILTNHLLANCLVHSWPIGMAELASLR